MKKLILSILVVLISNYSLSVKAEGNFCIQTFNTYGPLYGLNLDGRTQHLLEYLSDSERACPILQFQEVWRASHMENLKDGMSQIDPNLTPIYFDQIRKDDLMTGMLTFSSGKILQSGSEIYKYNRDGILDQIREETGVNKAFGFVVIENPQGQKILSINTHTHPTSSPLRITQVLQLLSFLELQPQLQDLPTLITGDFNAIPGSIEWKLMLYVLGFKDSIYEVSGSYDGLCTYCHTNPLSWSRKDSVFDYVFYRSGKNLRLTAADARIDFIEAPSMSDHYGIRTDFVTQIRENFQTNTQCTIKKEIAIETLKAAMESIAAQKFEAVNLRIGHWIKELSENPNSFLMKRLCNE